MLAGLIDANEKKMDADKSTQNFPITLAFKTFFWRILNCSLCWFTNVLVYYGLSLNSVALGGNKYDNFIWISAAEIPGFFSPVLLMDRIGRRYSLFGAMIVSGLSIGCSVFVPPAPMTPLLGVYYAEGPAIIFSICAIFSGFLALSFKETTEVELPNTLDDAEVIGNKKDERQA
uniref:Major facilitator superfamily (MFS) profile domain-containing protein n=1 Tax=Megaselia scalaris TaxID=36166 RepID=T1GIN1_MEGSC